MAQCVTKNLFHIFDAEGHTELINFMLRGTHAFTWSNALTNGLRRSVQCTNNTKGNDVFDFISRSDVPSDRIVTYTNIVCDY